MNNKRALIPITLVTLLVSGLRFSVPGVSGDSGTQDARPSVASTPSPTAAAVQSGRDEQPDTLDVLAESLGVDIGKDDLRREALQSVEALRDKSRAAEWPRAVWFLREFFRLPIRKDAPRLDEARTAAGQLAALYPPADQTKSTEDRADPPLAAVQIVERFLDQYFNEDALRVEHPTNEAKLLAEDFGRLDTLPLAFALLHRAANDDPKTIVRFLVATLPDAVDSHTGWQFDPMLDAIQQAITADDYLLDRFHLPDSDAERDSGASAAKQTRRVHEKEPGVVVFRKHRDDRREDPGHREDPKKDRELLVLLLVQESPTAGVHEAALVSALNLIGRWNARAERPAAGLAEDDRVFRILGPTFSGSAESLRQILRKLSFTTLKDARVRFVSGSATSRLNKEALENALPNRVVFQATVQPDDTLLCRQGDYLREAGWLRPVAVLFEANTQYGRQLSEELVRCPDLRSASMSDRTAIKRIMARIWGSTESPFSESDIIKLPFPMNISRLRATAQSIKPGAPDPWGLPSRFRPLALDEPGNPTDQLPVLSPKTTASYMELALAGLLQTLPREGIGTVALMATDSRDKLFLAQQINEYSPDVAIFTAESDSLYIHPDYSSYLRGTLVASTYGLFNANQRWSYPQEGSSSRLQFATGSAQGVYNATLALLDYDTEGRPVPMDAHVPPLVEYGAPGQKCSPTCGPPVWISVVGRDGSWPVRFYPDERGGENGYVFQVRPQTPIAGATAADPPGVSRVGFSPPLFTALLTFLTVAIVIFWLSVRGIGANALNKGLSRPFDALLPTARAQQLSALLAGRRSTDGEGRGYLLAAAVSLLVIEGFVAAICVTRLFIERQLGSESVWAAVAVVAAVVCLLMLIHLIVRALVEIVRRDVPHPWRRFGLKSISWPGALAVVFVGIFGWGVGNLQWYAWTQAWAPQVRAIGFLERATHLESGVCPTIPVLLLGAALFLWATSELTRLRNRNVSLAEQAVYPLVQQTVHGGVRDIEGSWSWLNRSMLAVPTGSLIVALLGVAATVQWAEFDPIVRPLVTIEGVHYGRFVSATLLLVQMMIALSLLQFISLWFGLKQLLQRMVFHPLARAYERVPRELLPPSLFPSVPRLAELQAPVSRWDRYVTEASTTEGGAAAIPAECFELRQVFQDEMRTAPTRAWSGRKTWKLLMNAASASAARLQRPVDPPADAPGRDCEEVVAISMVFVIRDALARLGHNLVFITGGVLLVFCSHTLFPFGGRHRLQALAWTYVGLTFACLFTVLLQIKRDEILGRVAAVTPGARSAWDANFVMRLAAFGLLPLLTLFAAQFPEVGGMLLQWLQPVQKVLP